MCEIKHSIKLDNKTITLVKMANGMLIERPNQVGTGLDLFTYHLSILQPTKVYLYPILTSSNLPTYLPFAFGSYFLDLPSYNIPTNYLTILVTYIKLVYLTRCEIKNFTNYHMRVGPLVRIWSPIVKVRDLFRTTCNLCATMRKQGDL